MIKTEHHDGAAVPGGEKHHQPPPPQAPSQIKEEAIEGYNNNNVLEKPDSNATPPLGIPKLEQSTESAPTAVTAKKEESSPIDNTSPKNTKDVNVDTKKESDNNKSTDYEMESKLIDVKSGEEKMMIDEKSNDEATTIEKSADIGTNNLETSNTKS
jgi:hypothetical protein